MDIIEKISLALEPLKIKNFYGWYDENINVTHITYTIFQELESNFSEDENENVEQYIQVDLWTKDIEEIQRLKINIKKHMKESGFYFIEANNDFEIKTKIYHYASRYLSIE